ncbi:MAG: hypothetical protein IIA77_04965 [Proteobacteria bacterium]|nr:hypothetical protein [Pseudomonadota bacterium]
MFEKLKQWLCRKLCKNLLYNSDMSREIDRLVAENEKLTDELNEQIF